MVNFQISYPNFTPSKILDDLLTQPKELTCAEIFSSGVGFLNILLQQSPRLPSTVWDAVIEATKDDERFNTQLAYDADKAGWLPLHIACDAVPGKPHSIDILRTIVRLNPAALITPVNSIPSYQRQHEHLYHFPPSCPYKIPCDLCGPGEVHKYLDKQTKSYLAWQIRRAAALSVARLVDWNVPTFARKRGGSGMKSKRGYFAFSVIVYFLTHCMEPLASEGYSYIGLNQNGPGVSTPCGGGIEHLHKQIQSQAEVLQKRKEFSRQQNIEKRKEAAAKKQWAYIEKFDELVGQGISRAEASRRAREHVGIPTTH